MRTQKNLTEETLQLRGLGYLVQTYEFIAASAMRRIRTSVLENRAFHLGLNAIYQEVRRASAREVAALAARRRFGRAKTPTVIRRPRKAAIALLSANTALYGDVIARSAARFIEEADKGEADVVVVGRLGRALFESERRGKKYTYFDFPDTSIDRDNLKAIARYLNQYETVTVFHGRFKSLVSQEIAATAVSGEDLETNGGAPKGSARYIFEPSLETILIFFETEIFGSLLEQVFHESRLAKLASRMVLLDRASVAVERAIKNMTLRGHAMRHRAMNRKQLDAMSGAALWLAS